MTPWQTKHLALEPICQAVETMAQECENFACRWFTSASKGRLLVIAGLSGTGKTHATRKLFQWARRASASLPGHAPLWVQWPEVVAEFNQKQFRAMNDMMEADLLFLDDLGAENDPWNIGKDRFCQLMNRRERKHTVITTNMLRHDWPAKFEMRIADRLHRNSVIVDLARVRSYAQTQTTSGL